MVEVARALEWIFVTLSTDATIENLVADRVHEGVAPQDTAYPFVIFNHQGGADVRGVGTYRAFDNSLYQVKAVTQSESYDEAVAIADAIDNALQGASGTASGGYIGPAVREQTLMLTEVSKGIVYKSAGGLYRLAAQEQ